MKSQYFTLPALQMAAAAFFATTAQAQQSTNTVSCVDKENVRVEDVNCDGSKSGGSFFLVKSKEQPAIGQVVTHITAGPVDSAAPAARKAAGFPEQGLVEGGFGRRGFKREDCNDSADCKENCCNSSS
ncbi:hypothetical protein UCDDA912_g02289 [Diaporthe ampelina]|uniref:Uncharacterized protein n=1 Tax=Diaporthe ampelina TaxID=1214573 RepID=A0A0G2HS71_9PEZI|nr:hypothetical protein UCDDA912_g02289 [Diaporthe ampelina]